MLGRILLIAGAAGLLAPAAAEAARPVATTGRAVDITTTTATVRGRVDANRAGTTYYFQIGTTRAYGSNTSPASAGARGRAIGVSAPVTGLVPATRYHYRRVAENADGRDVGRDRTFRASNEPLALSLQAIPNPVSPPGGPTQLAGRLTGTNSVGRQVVLQSNPFPYTQGFRSLGNPLLTDATGNFAFPILSLPITTQFRVFMPEKAEVVSPVVTADAAVRVRTAARKVARHRHSVIVRFRGSVLPPRDGVRVNVQKLRAGQWVTIAHTRARDATARRSRYAVRVRLYRSGRYRVLAESAGDFASGAGRAIRIRVRR
jgi:hypothetical protein